MDGFCYAAPGATERPPRLDVEDAAGWLLVLLPFGLALVDPKIYRSASVTLAYWFTIIAHSGNSLYSAYLQTSYFASQDAIGFHYYATTQNYPAVTLGTSEFYTEFLANAYQLFGPSLLFGQQLSVLASAVKVLIFIQGVSMLGYRRYLVPLILLCGALPPEIMFCSVTLREAYQSCFFLAAAVIAIQVRQTRNPLWLPLMYFCLFYFGASHQGLLVYALLSSAMMTLWALDSGPWRVRIVLRLVGVALALYMVNFALAKVESLNFGALAVVSTGDLENATEFAELYGERAPDSRTTYPVKLEFGSPVAMAVTAPIVFFQYLFEPMPWQIGSGMDVYAFFEGMLRLLLILAALVTAWRKPGEERAITLFLLVMGLGLEAMWAIGTYNWGTAIRHHLVAAPLLLLAGGPRLMSWCSTSYTRFMRFIFGRASGPR